MRLNACCDVLAFALALGPAGSVASAQTFGGFQAASIRAPRPIILKPGEDVVVAVEVRIRPGYHINSHKPAEDYLIATKLSWDPTPLHLKVVNYPEGETVKYSFSPKPLSVYSGGIEIKSIFSFPEKIKKGPEKIAEGTDELTGSLRYQACNDKACFPPQKIRVRVPLVLK